MSAVTPPAAGRPDACCWFVYCRVRAADLSATVAAARAAQAALCAHQPGLTAELWQRPSSDSSEWTLLESYRAGPGWSAERTAALPAAIDAALAPALAPWQRSPRRLEVFTPCA